MKQHDNGGAAHEMSLRDYLAAKAMHAEIVVSWSDATPDAAKEFIAAAKKAGHSMERHLAYNAYRIADAMIAERNRS